MSVIEELRSHCHSITSDKVTERKVKYEISFMISSIIILIVSESCYWYQKFIE